MEYAINMETTFTVPSDRTTKKKCDVLLLQYFCFVVQWKCQNMI